VKTLFRYSILLLIVLSANTVYAQSNGADGTFDGFSGAPQPFQYDTRTISMGTATVADPTHLMSIHMNPGLLTFVRQPNAIQFEASQSWENNLQSHQVMLPALEAGQHRVAVQLGYHRPGLSQTSLAGAIPDPVPALDMGQLHAAYAYSINHVLSVGVLNSFSFAYNPNAQFWTYNASTGLVYSPSESVRYGLVYRGLGRSITYEFIEDGRTTLGSQSLRNALELGATLTFPVDTDQTYLAISLSNEKQFGESGIWYKGGIELKTLSYFYLRSGIMFNPDQDTYIPRFGLGVNVYQFQLDYALSYKNSPMGRFHQIGLVYQF
jgi:hypothetical protein